MAAQPSDAHWEPALAAGGTKLPREILAFYRHAEYRSYYVPMRDGVELALDVLLPGGKGDRGAGACPTQLPCALHQTRYMRGMRPRGLVKRLTNGRPLDFLNLARKSYLLAAGYSVASLDVRGTGASGGAWRAPWSPEERADSCQVLDWIARQPWSNGQVVLWGASYEASTALFTAAGGHPALRGVAASYPFWDVYTDIAYPGGIEQHSFSREWSTYCAAMDANDFRRLAWPTSALMRLVTKGCQPVCDYSAAAGGTASGSSAAGVGSGHAVAGSSAAGNAQAGGGAAAGSRAMPGSIAGGPGTGAGSEAADACKGTEAGLGHGPGMQRSACTAGAGGQVACTCSADEGRSLKAGGNSARRAAEQAAPATGLPKGVPRHAKKLVKKRSRRRLKLAVAAHHTWNAAQALGAIRFTDQVDAQTGLTVADISVCSVAAQLRDAAVPLLLVTGWLDTTVNAALHCYHHAGHAPGTEVVIGPWQHGGLNDCRAGHVTAGRQHSAFPVEPHTIAFFDRCCGYDPPGRPAALNLVAVLKAGVKPGAADSAALPQATLPPQAVSDRAGCHPCTSIPEPPLADPPTCRGGGTVPAGSGGAGQPCGGHAAACACGRSDAATWQAIASPAGVARSATTSAAPADGEPPATAGPTRDAGSCSSATAASEHSAARSPPPPPRPIHYYVMGAQPGWRHCHSWPPPQVADAPPLQLFLAPAPACLAAGQPAGSSANHLMQAAGPARPACEAAGSSTVGAPSSAGTGAAGVPTVPERPGQAGLLCDDAPGAACRLEHLVQARKHLKGRSRYDGMTQLTKPVRYSGLRSSGHLLFTGAPLAQACEVVGSVDVDMWVDSIDADADLFVYLQDYDPVADKARYITEGEFRASHRREGTPAPTDARAAAVLPGAPFHSFAAAHAQPLVPGVPVRCRFQMQPTAYFFPQGHCMRVAFSGADAKHFTMDHAGPRTLGIHTGGATPTCVRLPIRPC